MGASLAPGNRRAPWNGRRGAGLETRRCAAGEVRGFFFFPLALLLASPSGPVPEAADWRESGEPRPPTSFPYDYEGPISIVYYDILFTFLGALNLGPRGSTLREGRVCAA